MIQISKNSWIHPENVEGMELDGDGLRLFMVSGRVLTIIDDVIRIMKDIEDWFEQDIKEVKEEPVKQKRKYTKRVKKDEDNKL